MIHVEGIGKRYRLGAARHDTLRDTLAHWAGKVFRKGEDTGGTDSFWALKDVSFDVAEGEVVGIIGKNGAGKSTLLKVLSRITPPTEGRIRLKGRVASLLEVGTGFHPELSGRDNIFMNGAILGMTRREIQQKFDEIVAFSEIEKFLDTPVKHYSSGMYVRLAFAVAAHLEPEILIVDEVLAVGDAEFQKKCLGKMGEVAKGGRTVLFVSHNMEAVRNLCSRAVWLREGKVRGIGPVDEQVEEYLSDIRARLTNHEFSFLKLTPTVSLTQFSLTPNPFESGHDLVFNLSFRATEDQLIKSVVVLIYSVSGVRVGILDLRKLAGQFKVGPGNDASISGRARSVNLVPSEYSLGIYVETREEHRNYMDIMDLVVSAKPSKGSLVPYPPSVSGFVDLEIERV